MVSMTIRLFTWQVEKLKQSKYPVEVLRRAYARYSKGELCVVQSMSAERGHVDCTTLTPFTIRKRFPVSDSEMREILTKHWSNPDMKQRRKLEMEIKKMDGEIDEWFKMYANKPYIVEDA